MADKNRSPSELEQNLMAISHLSEWLSFRKISQRTLAEKMECSEPTVSKWLSGKQSMTIAQFYQIASILGAKPADLFFSPQESPPDSPMRRLAETVAGLPDEAINALILSALAMRPKD